MEGGEGEGDGLVGQEKDSAQEGGEDRVEEVGRAEAGGVGLGRYQGLEAVFGCVVDVGYYCEGEEEDEGGDDEEDDEGVAEVGRCPAVADEGGMNVAGEVAVAVCGVVFDVDGCRVVDCLLFELASLEGEPPGWGVGFSDCVEYLV